MTTAELYDQWLKNPTPDNMGAILRDLDSTITAETARYSGGPVLKTKARRMTVDAVKSFDPTRGAQLRSWVVTQLQPLSRYHQQLTPLKVPEAAARKAAEVHRITVELSDQLGRLPTDTELADRIGISEKRIGQLRNMSKAMISESALSGTGNTGEEFSMSPAVASSTPSATDAAEELYKGMDDRSRFIFDSATGMHGKKRISKAEIAGRLGVTPAFVSQQSALLADQVAKAQETLANV